MNSLKTYRSLFKWGDPAQEEKLEVPYQELIRDVFGTRDEKDWVYLHGDREVRLKHKSRLSKKDVSYLQKLVDVINVETDDYSRSYHACGKTYLDLIQLRLGIVEYPPDAVVYPRDEKDVINLITYCTRRKIAVTPFGGHSSVTRGVECPMGGISLDLTRHMNRVLEVNEINLSVEVQPGIFGPDFESTLNQYGKGYTCGHFPQSFEYSTVGGWIATRGAGQQSTGYGKIEDMVLALRLVTPQGVIVTRDYPRKALGPDLNQILIGSEGTLGVITEATLKIRSYQPENRRYFSFLFKTWEDAVEAMREIAQGEFGFPSFFRLSDPEETDIALRAKRIDRNLIAKGLSLLGFQPMKRSLMLGMTEGDRDSGKLIQEKIVKICKRKKGLSVGRQPVDTWYRQRYSSAYLRDPLMDAGIMTDTLETAVTWENLHAVRKGARKVIKSRKKSICMTHVSHVYENGANLYFTFLTPIRKGKEIEDYLKLQTELIEVIQEKGGSLSHHHGIGRMLAPWMKGEVGEPGLNLLRAIKKYLDPKEILNPGTTLGLKEEE